MRARVTVLSVFLALFSVSSTAEINQRVDRVVFSIHVDTVPQLDLNELEQAAGAGRVHRARPEEQVLALGHDQ